MADQYAQPIKIYSIDNFEEQFICPHCRYKMKARAAYVACRSCGAEWHFNMNQFYWKLTKASTKVVPANPDTRKCAGPELEKKPHYEPDMFDFED